MYLCRAITEDNLHVRTDRLCTHADAATKEEARRFVEQKLGEIEISVDNLRAQIAGETYRLLPLSYIAEHYFGKSAAPQRHARTRAVLYAQRRAKEDFQRRNAGYQPSYRTNPFGLMTHSPSSFRPKSQRL